MGERGPKVEKIQYMRPMSSGYSLNHRRWSASQAPCKLCWMSKYGATEGVGGGGGGGSIRVRVHVTLFVATPPIKGVSEMYANSSVNVNLHWSLHEHYVDSGWAFKREWDFANCLQGKRRKSKHLRPCWTHTCAARSNKGKAKKNCNRYTRQKRKTSTASTMREAMLWHHLHTAPGVS